MYRLFSDCDGNPVDLSDERWDHVLLRHEIMRGCEDLIGTTLERPDARTEGAQADRECFYRRGLHPAAPLSLVKVVVEYRPHLDARRGRIITAFLVEKVPPGEVPIWKT